MSTEELPADLPPRLPATLEDLDAARRLLGEAARTELTPPIAERLVRLVEAAPATREQAAAWKRSLKVLREEMLGELGSAQDQRPELQRLSRAS